MRNVGSTDRIVRAAAGLGVLAIGYYFGSYWGLICLIPLGTSVFGVCPMYSMCKLNSCQNRKLKT